MEAARPQECRGLPSGRRTKAPTSPITFAHTPSCTTRRRCSPIACAWTPTTIPFSKTPGISRERCVRARRLGVVAVFRRWKCSLLAVCLVVVVPWRVDHSTAVQSWVRFLGGDKSLMNCLNIHWMIYLFIYFPSVVCSLMRWRQTWFFHRVLGLCLISALVVESLIYCMMVNGVLRCCGLSWGASHVNVSNWLTSHSLILHMMLALSLNWISNLLE